MIVIGVDAHKRTHTAVAVEAATGSRIGLLTTSADRIGHEQLLAWARREAGERRWALEDCRHVSGGLERFLLEQAEQVIRVPPKLMAGVRRSARVPGKSDPIDATAVAHACLREPDLPPALLDQEGRELKLLVDYRDGLVAERSRIETRLRWLLHELELGFEIPARALGRAVWQRRLQRRLARLQPGAGVRIARSLLARCRRLSREINALERELGQLVAERAPQLLELPGCATLTAAKLLAESGPPSRFRGEASFARHAGVAPVDVSSGAQRRHRLNRFGNRQLNCALHRLAITQARLHEPARLYLARKQAEGKSKREALRCLKRQLARVVFRLMLEAERQEVRLAA